MALARLERTWLERVLRYTGSLSGGGIGAREKLRWAMGLVDRRGDIIILGEWSVGCAVGDMVGDCGIGSTLGKKSVG